MNALRRPARSLAPVLAALAVALGCAWETPIGIDALDGSIDATTGIDAARPDGSSGECQIATCGGRVYECGNCLDDDDDGLVDADDPACIGACDDTEDRYDVNLRDTPACSADCYFDSDQGSGNDGCSYDSRCDPLSPDVPHCPHDESATCPTAQPALCAAACGPLVPNGCDCFGCCELPAGSGSFVFLGSADDDGVRRCAPETLGDESVCRPCTPHLPCLNRCDACEVCIGRGVPAADCVDGGVDASMPAPRCEPGVVPCGQPGDASCPTGEYCLTGCCRFFG